MISANSRLPLSMFRTYASPTDAHEASEPFLYRSAGLPIRVLQVVPNTSSRRPVCVSMLSQRKRRRDDDNDNDDACPIPSKKARTLASSSASSNQIDGSPTSSTCLSRQVHSKQSQTNPVDNLRSSQRKRPRVMDSDDHDHDHDDIKNDCPMPPPAKKQRVVLHGYGDWAQAPQQPWFHPLTSHSMTCFVQNNNNNKMSNNTTNNKNNNNKTATTASKSVDTTTKIAISISRYNDSKKHNQYNPSVKRRLAMPNDDDMSDIYSNKPLKRLVGFCDEIFFN